MGSGVGAGGVRCFTTCVSAYLLPVCRQHIVDEFNRGVYDYVIATDEAHGSGILDNTCHVTTSAIVCTYTRTHTQMHEPPHVKYCFKHIPLTTVQLCQ